MELEFLKNQLTRVWTKVLKELEESSATPLNNALNTNICFCAGQSDLLRHQIIRLPVIQLSNGAEKHWQCCWVISTCRKRKHRESSCSGGRRIRIRISLSPRFYHLPQTLPASDSRSSQSNKQDSLWSHKWDSSSKQFYLEGLGVQKLEAFAELWAVTSTPHSPGALLPLSWLDEEEVERLRSPVDKEDCEGRAHQGVGWLQAKSPNSFSLNSLGKFVTSWPSLASKYKLCTIAHFGSLVG